MDLILPDEPTASLNPKNKRIVLNSLRYLVNEGKPVVVVSHDLELFEFSDNIINLSDETYDNR